MSILRDTRRANFQLFPLHPNLQACFLASLLSCFAFLSCLLACLLACFLAGLLKFSPAGRRGEEEAGPPVKDALQAMDGFLDSQLALGLQV